MTNKEFIKIVKHLEFIQKYHYVQVPMYRACGALVTEESELEIDVEKIKPFIYVGNNKKVTNVQIIEDDPITYEMRIAVTTEDNDGNVETYETNMDFRQEFLTDN